MAKLDLKNSKKIYTENELDDYFGYQNVSKSEKSKKVLKVFESVAWRYDLMNDLMSFGLHRIWKNFLVYRIQVRPGMKVLDVAGGTGDLAIAFAKIIRSTGEVWLTDISASMLHIARDRLINSGMIIPTILCDAESLPFPEKYFDRISLSFGLRNITNKDRALKEIVRILKIGGKFTILEFSKTNKCLKSIYDRYSFYIIPWLGEKIAKDKYSYRYLVESIRMHPDQDTLAKMMLDVGLNRVRYFNMTGGIVALHEGFKIS